MNEKLESFLKLLKEKDIEAKIEQEEEIKIISNEDFLATVKSNTLYFLEYPGKDSKVPVLDITEKLKLNLFVPASLYREKGVSLREIFIDYIKKV